MVSIRETPTFVNTGGQGAPTPGPGASGSQASTTVQSADLVRQMREVLGITAQVPLELVEGVFPVINLGLGAGVWDLKVVTVPISTAAGFHLVIPHNPKVSRIVHTQNLDTTGGSYAGEASLWLGFRDVLANLVLETDHQFVLGKSTSSKDLLGGAAQRYLVPPDWSLWMFLNTATSATETVALYTLFQEYVGQIGPSL